MLTFNQIVLVAVAGLVLYGIWRATGEKWSIQIFAGPDRVEFVKGVALSHQAKIANFLQHDLALAAPITILAAKDPRGFLRIKIKGPADAELCQRIRNFLLLTL